MKDPLWEEDAQEMKRILFEQYKRSNEDEREHLVLALIEALCLERGARVSGAETRAMEKGHATASDSLTQKGPHHG